MSRFTVFKLLKCFFRAHFYDFYLTKTIFTASRRSHKGAGDMAEKHTAVIKGNWTQLKVRLDADSSALSPHGWRASLNDVRNT